MYILAWTFILVPFAIVDQEKLLRGCAFFTGSSELLLAAYAINTKISGSHFNFVSVIFVLIQLLK